MDYEFEKREYEKKRSFNRTPLILSLIGLILSCIYGTGIVFGFIGLIMGAKRYKKNPSRPLKWSIIISVLDIILCVAFISLLIYATVFGNFLDGIVA